MGRPLIALWRAPRTIAGTVFFLFLLSCVSPPLVNFGLTVAALIPWLGYKNRTPWEMCLELHRARWL